MADLRHYSHAFLTEFIELYKNNPCLWKIKSKDYTNKNKKSVAYDVLIEKLKEVDTNASKESVVKKINSLRGSFRKEIKKVKASEKSGAGEDDVYKPTLWYFDQLYFLMDQETPRQSISNMDASDDDELETRNWNDKDNDTLEDSTPVDSSDAAPDTHFSQAISRTSAPTRAHRGKCDKSDEILNLVANKLKETDSTGTYTAYGNNVAEELRALPKEQSIYCQKIINDALFEAKLGNLNKNTVIITNNEQYMLMSPNIFQQLNVQSSYPSSQATQIQTSRPSTQVHPNTVNNQQPQFLSTFAQTLRNDTPSHQSQNCPISQQSTVGLYLASYSPHDENFP